MKPTIPDNGSVGGGVIPIMEYMRFRLKTLLIVVAVVAVCLTVLLAIQNHRHLSRQAALSELQSGGVLLLRSNPSSDTISFAEIWVTEKTKGSFDINGSEFPETDAKRQLIKFRLCLSRLQIRGVAVIDSEPGTTNSRGSTIKLAYASGFVSVCGQGSTTYEARREFFESKKLLNDLAE